jgi:hypothetical protein
MNDDAKDRPRAGAKQAYEPPRLVTYGDVTLVTQSKAQGKNKDNATKGKSRTT